MKDAVIMFQIEMIDSLIDCICVSIRVHTSMPNNITKSFDKIGPREKPKYYLYYLRQRISIIC
jgi:hypothetical protein